MGCLSRPSKQLELLGGAPTRDGVLCCFVSCVYAAVAGKR